jgi:hypothetical protein
MYLAEAEGGGAAAGCESVGRALLVAAISPENGENHFARAMGQAVEQAP